MSDVSDIALAEVVAVHEDGALLELHEPEEQVEGQGSILRFIQSDYFLVVQVQINIEKDGKSFSMVKMSNLRRSSNANNVLEARGEVISENICK